MKGKFKPIFGLLKRSVKKYKQDNPMQLAGTTAFFAIFAMAPLIIIMDFREKFILIPSPFLRLTKALSTPFGFGWD